MVAIYGAFRAFASWFGLLAMGFEEQSTMWVDVMWDDVPPERTRAGDEREAEAP